MYLLEKEKRKGQMEKMGSTAHGEKKGKGTVSMVTGRGTVLVVACETGS